MYKILVFSMFCYFANGHMHENLVEESDNWWPAELSVLQRFYDDCQNKNDVSDCLKTRALGALSRAVDQETINLAEGVTMVRRNGSSFFPAEPRLLDGLNGVDRALVQRLDAFLRTHTLSVDLSEGRKKKHKLVQYVAMAIITATAIAGPLALKTLAAIAGKALVISKVALTIAGIIALKKLFSQDHHEEASFQVHASSGGEHNRRNMYLVKPVKATIVDPYRYYYDHQQQYQQQMPAQTAVNA